MTYQNPSIADFKSFFDRDFPFGSDIETQVRDQDIAKAMQLSNRTINQALFSTQEDYNLGYEYLTAHFLVTNLRASSQGINGQYSFLESGKSVGSVSQSFAIPENILRNPLFSMYTKTNYGAMYLELIYPLLSGQVFSVQGTTRP